MRTVLHQALKFCMNMLFHIHKRTTMTSGNHPPRSVAELFTLSQVVIYQLVTIACLYIKAPVLKTCECFSWRNKHSRVCVTFPILILAISRLCRLVCYSNLTYGVIRCHYHCICSLNIRCRSQQIPGVGSRETPNNVVGNQGRAWDFLLPKDVLALQLVHSFLVDIFKNPRE
jgi:hypothetical protein